MRCAAVALLLTAAAMLGPASAAISSLAFQVEPRLEECMYQEIKQGQSVRAEILVTRGGKLDVRMKIDAPGKGRLYEQLVFSNIDDSTGNVVDSLIKKGHSVSCVVPPSCCGPEDQRQVPGLLALLLRPHHARPIIAALLPRFSPLPGCSSSPPPAGTSPFAWTTR